MRITKFACLLLFTMLLNFIYAAITPTSPLSIGQTLSSSTEVYELGFFSPNNTQDQYVGIWLKGIIPQVVLLDTGNLIVIDKVLGRNLWQSFDHLVDSMLPFSTLMYNLATVLTSWKSNTDPSPGDFVVQITPQVPSQAFTIRGSTPYWRSGPWAKTRFPGIPQMDETYTNISEGSLKIVRHNGTGWELNFDAPTNSFDYYGVCGPFGLCVMSVPPKCNCFKGRGFTPKHIEEWKKEIRLVVVSESTEECYQSCLYNCSCLTFAFVHGIGCLMWNRELMDTGNFFAGGEIFSIRLARGNKRKKTIVASTLSLSLFVLLGSAAFGFWRYCISDTEMNDLEPQDVTGLNFFDLHTETATNNFSMSNKLGQGGFGSVFKVREFVSFFLFSILCLESSSLQDGKEIAVKRLSSSSGQGKEEFMNEIVLISKLQHRNLVRILGCCVEGEERLLIYEFMVNKSLDTFIFDSRRKLEINWPKRFNIIQSVARGLLYLHRDSGGYMSPEYAWTGVFSEKSDIYSFGVLMLETISGEKISRFSYDEEFQKPFLALIYLADILKLQQAWESWCETRGVDFLDRDVADSCHHSEVGRCVQIGLLC
ncbi:hypothetical protein EUTSA_v10023836mg, partial [Eutrema salsugineum]